MLCLLTLFWGSGVTLVDVVRVVGAERVGVVWGVEPLSLPALVAYTALVDALGGRRELVRVVVGDAFDVVPRLFSPLGGGECLGLMLS